MTLELQRPTFSPDEALNLANRLYGLSGSVQSLPSERDQNFVLTAVSGDRFVLKISGSGEPDAHLELQNAALTWLAEQTPGLPVPRLRPAETGEVASVIVGRDGQRHSVRLLSYLSGEVLARARPHSAALLRDLGRTLATMDRSLLQFTHPAARRDFPWNLGRAPETVTEYRSAVTGSRRQRIIDRVLEQWTAMVTPVLPSLRTSVIYNDANDYNVLVEATGREPRRITGFVDFGDLVECATVCDPAIAVAYAVLGKPDPLAAAAQIVGGYHDALPLTEPELEALFALACGRLALSVCISAQRRLEEPENDYLAVSEQPAWDALEQLTTIHPRFARDVLRAACGLTPCPHSQAVVHWLQRHANAIGPVMDPDPRRAPATTLDLSIESPLLTDPEEITGTEVLADVVLSAMTERGARFGVGRYDEARYIYLTEAFEGPQGELPERRTIHLGVDLFSEPGTPVLAPLDARVHSVKDNAAALDYGPTVILEHEPSDGPRFYTLYGHLGPDCLRSLSPGDNVRQGERLASVGEFAVNGNWPPHLHFQLITDLLDRDGEFPGVAAPSQRAVWLSLSPDPNLVVGLPGGVRADAAMSRDTILQARNERLGPSLSIAYETPLHIVRGRAQYLYDEVGHAYLDCVNNVCHVGHCHPRVVMAAQRQIAVLNTNTRYLHQHLVRYAERLCATLPDPLSICYFVCSGSEANELALRMARTHTGAEDLIVLQGGYHGNTAALVDASPYKFDGPGGRGAPPHVHKVVMPDDYRGPYRRDDPACGAKYAAFVRDTIAAVHRTGRRVAAFLSETLLGCGGQIELPPGYLRDAYRYARTHGAVCIADEVQVGFGRVGTHFWGFETQDVVPDIVTMGKPIGNGHPLAAVVTTRDIAESFHTGMEYFNTFGGNPVSCAVGMAVLDVIEGEGLQAHARHVGGRLRRGLESLMDVHAIVGDVRGRGLFLGVELVLDRVTRTPATEEAAYVVERAKDHGILLSTDGPDRNVLKIKPPLPFSAGDADRLVATLEGIFREDFVRHQFAVRAPT